MTNKLVIILLFITIQSAIAQKLDAVRLEVKSDINTEQFHVESIGSSGLMIFYESNEVNSEKKRKWYFGLFDTELEQEWLKFVPLSDKIEFVATRKANGDVYFLFKNIARDRADFGYYEIVTYNIANQSFARISGSIPSKAEVVGFDIIGNKACIALNLKRQAIDLVLITISNGDIFPVHIDADVPGYIEALYADKENELFYVSIKQNKDRRYISEHLQSYTPQGELKKSIKIENIEPLKFFRDYTFISNKDELLIFGTYDIVTGKTLSFRDVEEDEDAKSVGMFCLKFDNGTQESLKYYDFMGFNNITGAIGTDNITTNKMMHQDTGKIRSGNHMVSASFHLSEPNVFRADNGSYIFSVEVYRPNYKTETRMDYDFYGRPYPYTYNVFSGYEFYDVIITGISSTGDMMWSNDFTIRDILTYSTKRISTIFNDDNFITIAYVNNGEVISQTIEGPADIDRSEMKIGTDFPQDRVTQDENNRIIRWYDDYFLIYGYQKVKNRTMGEQSTRVIFYANKIAYK
jgi:hypothetical protein